MISTRSSAGRRQSYDSDRWEPLRSEILKLYATHQMTRPMIVEILASQHNFFVNVGQLTYRLGTWGCFKNRNRKRLQKNLSLPIVQQCRELILTSLRKFATGVVDSEFWETRTILSEKVADMWSWAKGSPSGMYRVLALIRIGNIFYDLGRKEWGQSMHKDAFDAFGKFVVLSTHTNTAEPTQSIHMLLSIMLALQKYSAEVRLQFLNTCTRLASETTHPFAQILLGVLTIERQNLGIELLIFVLTEASDFTVDRFRDVFGQSNLAVDLCKLVVDISVGRGRTSSQPWVDPSTVLDPDQELSDCEDEIERMIVTATEFFDFEQLIQVQNALQKMLQPTDVSDGHRKMISSYLRDLEVPINRMRVRDYFWRGNTGGFKEFWRLLVNREVAGRDISDSLWIMDMVFGWRAFEKWGDRSEVEAIIERLGAVL